MYKQHFRTAVLIVVLLITSAVSFTSAEELKKLRKGDITVTYPAGLDDKARELADFATKEFLPIRDQLRERQEALADTGKVARRIVEWLGCPEEQKTAERDLTDFSSVMSSIHKLFTNFRLYRESDIEASGGVSSGPVSLLWDQSLDHCTFKFWVSGRKPDPSVFMPVVLTRSGELSCAAPLDQVVDNLSAYVLPFALILPHEIAESVLINKLQIYHPYARWFNDGIATWVNMQIVDEFVSDQRKEFRRQMLPDDEDNSRRPTINLLAWLQLGYMPGDTFRERLMGSEGTNYPFAAEAVTRMLRGLPDDTLAKIIGVLKGKRNPDTDTICAAIKEVTGRDAKSILLEYVPKHVKEGLEKKEDVSLYERAKSLVGEKDYLEMCRLLQASIEIRPSNKDAHLNLAWAMRRSGAPKELSERELVIAHVLSYNDASTPDYFQKDEEAGYLLGRTWQRSGSEDARAREIFNWVLKINPNHADAIAALAELDKAQKDEK